MDASVFNSFYIPIQGTWAWDKANHTDWWEHKSPFAVFLADRGMHIYNASRQFEWSTDLNVTGDKRDWKAAGKALCYYAEMIPFEARNFIVHSHGLQPLLYAGMYGLQIRNVISVGSPRRNDVLKETGRERILHWKHVLDATWDRIALMGQLLDGQFTWNREQHLADENIKIKGISHSRLLNEEEKFRHLVEYDLINFLRHGIR